MFKTSRRRRISSLRFPAITALGLSNTAAWPADTGEHGGEEERGREMIGKRNSDSLANEDMHVLSRNGHYTLLSSKAIDKFRLVIRLLS